MYQYLRKARLSPALPHVANAANVGPAVISRPTCCVPHGNKRQLEKKRAQRSKEKSRKEQKTEDVPVAPRSFSSGPFNPLVRISIAVSSERAPSHFCGRGRVSAMSGICVVTETNTTIKKILRNTRGRVPLQMPSARPSAV